MAKVRVSSNAESPDELQGVLDDISEVLGVPAEPGGMVLLESGEPPFEAIIHLAEIIDALGVLADGVKGGAKICASLYEKLRKRYKGRRVQVLFEAPDPSGKRIHYPVKDDTPNDAVEKIAYDCAREVENSGPMRFWIGERWMTYDEYLAAEGKTRNG
jgi:hypothetical protein